MPWFTLICVPAGTIGRTITARDCLMMMNICADCAGATVQNGHPSNRLYSANSSNWIKACGSNTGPRMNSELPMNSMKSIALGQSKPVKQGGKSDAPSIA